MAAREKADRAEAETAPQPPETSGPTLEQSPATNDGGGAATAVAAPEDELAQVFQALRDAQNEKDLDKARQKIEDVLGDLDDTQRAIVLGNGAIQKLIERASTGSGKLKPGTKLRDKHGRLYGKVPWTRESMVEAYGGEEAMIKWIAPQTRTIIVNGIDLYVKAGEEVTSPPIFQQIAAEAYQAEIGQRQTAEKIMKKNFGGFGWVGDANE